MTELITGGAVGLLTGMAVRLCGLIPPKSLRCFFALRQGVLWRMLLTVVGVGMMLTALLGWLAVIDVDTLTVRPLHGGVVLGGLLFGGTAGLVGRTPGTALCGIGGGKLSESLCTVIGCLIGAVVYRLVSPWLQGVKAWLPASANTFFRVTLDEPFLLSGGFLGLFCLGLLVLALSACVRPKAVMATNAQNKLDNSPAATNEETTATLLPDTPNEDTAADIATLEEDAAPLSDSAEFSPDTDPAQPVVPVPTVNDTTPFLHPIAVQPLTLPQVSDTPEGPKQRETASKADNGERKKPRHPKKKKSHPSKQVASTSLQTPAKVVEVPVQDGKPDARKDEISEEVQEEAFVSALPGEEPLVIDTAADHATVPTDQSKRKE